MKITYRKISNQVVMLNQAIDNDNLASAIVAKDPMMEQGYQMYYENGTIRYEKPPWMLNDEKQEQMKDDFEKDLIKITKAVDDNDKKELKELLTNLATKCYNQ